jgi:branched-subunit amino acid transport protein
MTTAIENPLKLLRANRTAILPRQVDRIIPSAEYPLTFCIKSFLMFVRVAIITALIMTQK